MSKKLEKVLEYLINNQNDAAKELLHQVFIEKARAIHEDLINMEEEDMDLEGDEGEDFGHEVGHHSDELDELSHEIESEETMAEADDEMDMDMADAEDDLGDEMGSDDDMMDMDADADMGGDEPKGEMAGIESTMDELEDALAALKAEFEKLEGGVADEASEEEFASDEAGEEEAGEEEAGEEEFAADVEDEEMDESWLAEFDDLEESVDLDKATIPSNAEVGAGKYAKAETNTKSPVAASQKDMFGAKPVVTGKGTAKSGYERETAPSATQMAGIKDNRRKKATDGQSSVSKEGDASAMLNKTKSEFHADSNKKSPLSTSPRK